MLSVGTEMDFLDTHLSRERSRGELRNVPSDSTFRFHHFPCLVLLMRLFVYNVGRI